MKTYNRQDFAYAVSSITGFTDQLGGELMAKYLIGAQTVKHINIRTGIKGTQMINLLNSTPAFQSGACGWNASGTTTFTQVSLTTCPERINENFCVNDLYSTYQSMLLTKGQNEESIPFEQQIAELKLKQIQQRIDSKLWTATTGGGDCFNGFKTLIASGQTGVGVSVSGTTFSPTAAYGSAGNPITEVDKLVLALDDDGLGREDLVVFMSNANFVLYLQALTKANFYQNYIGSSNVTGNMIATHPNHNIKVVPTYGLTGSNAVVIGPAEYMVAGFDLESDSEKVDIWYSRDNDEVRLRASYSYGAAVVKFGSTKYFAHNGLA